MKLEQITEDRVSASVTSETVEDRPAASVHPTDAERIADLTATVEGGERRRRALVWLTSGAFITVSFILAGLIIRLIDGNIAAGVLDALLFVAIVCALGGPMAAALLLSVPSKRLRDSMRLLARLSNVDQLNVLLQLHWTLADSNTKGELNKALTRAFLSVRASDADRITPASKMSMIRILSTVADGVFNVRKPDLHCALIRAMEQIGDENALKLVERASKLHGRSEARRRIRETALECLPGLRDRVRNESAHEILLRAAGQGDIENLLRPAESEDSLDSGLLLRPNVGYDVEHFS